MSSKVVSGDYNSKPITVAGGVPVIVMGWNPKNNIKIDTDTVARYEVVSEGEKKMAGRAAAGAILAGPLGLAVGALSAKAKGMLVAIEFRDGKKSLIECDQKTYKILLRSCYNL